MIVLEMAARQRAQERMARRKKVVQAGGLAERLWVDMTESTRRSFLRSRMIHLGTMKGAAPGSVDAVVARPYQALPLWTKRLLRRETQNQTPLGLKPGRVWKGQRVTDGKGGWTWAD